MERKKKMAHRYQPQVIIMILTLVKNGIKKKFDIQQKR